MKKIICLLTMVALFAACQKKTDKAPSDCKVLRTCFTHTPLTIDPRRTGDPISCGLSFMLFEGLTRIDADRSYSNGLADKIDISEDYKTYTFHLRPSNWTDGHPITAHDFEYSWKTTLHPDFPSICPYLFYSILGAEKAKKGDIPVEDIGVKALDDLTLEVKLEHPTPYFLTLVSFCAFFPIPKHIDSNNPDWFKTYDHSVVCSGPYKIQRWQHDSKIIVEKNPEFWEADQTQLSAIDISIIPDQNTSLQMYEHGELDWLGGMIADLSLDALTSLHKEGKIKSAPGGNTVFISFNVHSKPFHNLNMRKAFSCAIDRTAITKHITQLSEIPAAQVVPPALTGDSAQSLISTDAQLELAREYFEMALDELGLTRETLPKIALTFPSVEVFKKVGEALQEQWREAFGIEVESNFCEMKVFFDKLQHKTYQIAEAAWWAQYLDPMNILERFRYAEGSKNYPGWENPKYLSLMNQIETTIDAEKRTQLMQAAEKVIIEDVPLTPVYHFSANFLEKPHVEGVVVTPLCDTQFRRAKIADKKTP